MDSASALLTDRSLKLKGLNWNRSCQCRDPPPLLLFPEWNGFNFTAGCSILSRNVLSVLSEALEQLEQAQKEAEESLMELRGVPARDS